MVRKRPATRKGCARKPASKPAPPSKLSAAAGRKPAAARNKGASKPAAAPRSLKKPQPGKNTKRPAAEVAQRLAEEMFEAGDRIDEAAAEQC